MSFSGGTSAALPRRGQMTIEVKLRRAEGALQRLLCVLRRRGYEVTDLEAHTTDDGASLAVAVTLESDRPSDVLARHVAKLIECEAVALRDREPPVEVAAE